MRLALLLSTVLLIGCNLQNAPVEVTSDRHLRTQRALSPAEMVGQIESLRREKDRSFKQDKSSPLSPEDRSNFKGLNYFPIDTIYTLRVKLQRYPEPERVKMLTSTGEQRDYLRYGYFEFTLAGGQHRLDVFKLPDTSHLFIPFRDSTSGNETYGAGRYLDLEESADDLYILDFNLAYNPYCAYNSRYSCPIPPPQNTLSLPIMAGEKNYH